MLRAIEVIQEWMDAHVLAIGLVSGVTFLALVILAAAYAKGFEH